MGPGRLSRKSSPSVASTNPPEERPPASPSFNSSFHNPKDLLGAALPDLVRRNTYDTRLDHRECRFEEDRQRMAGSLTLLDHRSSGTRSPVRVSGQMPPCRPARRREGAQVSSSIDGFMMVGLAQDFRKDTLGLDMKLGREAMGRIRSAAVDYDA